MFQDRLTPVVKVLLLLNIGIFLLANLIGFEEVTNFMSLKYFKAPGFHPYQFVTHMFMHSGIMHLVSNMFGLFMFGPMLENVWGPKRFLTFYLICGLGGALFYTGVNAVEFQNTLNKIEVYNQSPSPNTYELILNREFKGMINPSDEYFSNFIQGFQQHPKSPEYIEKGYEDLKYLYNAKISIPVVGASGAIFGILLAFGMLFPNTVLMLLFPPIPIKAKYFVLIYGLWELYSGIQRATGDNVAHFAHLGGMIFGYFLIVYWKKNRGSFY